MTTVNGKPPRRVRLPAGEEIVLDPILASAGEGTIYGVVNRPELAAKVFHPELKGFEDKLEKVAAMIETPPRGRVQPDGFVVLTWPAGLVFDGGSPIGFVMARIDTSTSVELHTMSNPSNRQDPLPRAPQWPRHATWGHLVNTAANLCLAVQTVHRVDAVIGDFQERNILVSDTTQVTLVDCDSMQFIGADGRKFLCGVGRPEFMAPELAGLDLRVQPREQPSDLFALAVHIHQLLMAGNHPFMRGDWLGAGPQPDAFSLAQAGSWAGGPGSSLKTHPLAPPLTFLPADLQQLFVRAFTEGARTPTRRPTAREWREALLQIEVTTCARGGHQVPVTTDSCPWCAVEDARSYRQRAASHQSRPAVMSALAPRRAAGPRPIPSAPKPEAPDYWLGVNPKLVIAGLIVVVTIVVALASFIVWAVLSGASTFGMD